MLTTYNEYMQKDHTHNPNFTEKPLKPDLLAKKLHSAEGRLADFITHLAGSMFFVYFHVAWFAFWFFANEGYFTPFIQPFDHFPFGLLTMLVSLEAIFLSTFIMISQNRQALVDTYREYEEEQEQREEELEQEQLEEEVEDIQKDLDDIKQAVIFIQQKLSVVEKSRNAAAANANKPKAE